MPPPANYPNVTPIASAAEQRLAVLFRNEAELERQLAEVRRRITEEGQALWRQRNPDQRLFMKMRTEDVRKMLP